ncbi:MAG: 2-oxo-4-hydroxy-4-carboxy-5-ureidoimidazoline decarboxylase, partial [Alphaproteobacteria bacterium]
DVTEDSAREQAGAGLDRLTVEEYARFADLNDRYRARFGIPFISAVRGATKYQILTSYEQRIVNDGEDEFETAIEQVIRIVRFRLEDRVAP